LEIVGEIVADDPADEGLCAASHRPPVFCTASMDVVDLKKEGLRLTAAGTLSTIGIKDDLAIRGVSDALAFRGHSLALFRVEFSTSRPNMVAVLRVLVPLALLDPLLVLAVILASVTGLLVLVGVWSHASIIGLKTQNVKRVCVLRPS
jgi:hypothetical protein